ncbi:MULTISPECIES: DUF6687 family protein [Pseudomonas]|uniref:DUF6687 family protein n=1 Tax=Pseudomonas TaxID=286 RepID=UPI002114629C|nr:MULTISPECIES: DUF6687 family protein [unclassified Pseudomonas]MCV2230456.1 hypothetical protein [Pseudomonas sp. AU10]
MLGGRAIGIINNHFIDLPSAIGIDRDSPFRYLPLGQTAQVPNISLDSIDNAATLLTLSHWPSNHAPARYKANLSTQSAFHCLREGAGVDGASIVTSDHFDLDGLASIYAFLAPASALRHQVLLIDVARLGDFSRGTSPQALRTAFTFNALAAQAKPPGTLDADTALLQIYKAVLPNVEHVLEHTEHYAHCYLEGMDHLARSERLLSHPDTRLVEYAAIDLAVFHLPAGLGSDQFSGIPRARRDLAIFSRALQQDEREGCTWQYGGVENIMPALKCDRPGTTRYSSTTVLMELRQFLAVAPVAWRGSRPIS